MPQTRIFRDRIVSMEQTLEGGEKHLELLKALCREALPEWQYGDHTLDHERDLFTITLRSPDGVMKVISWTRMMLFDAERIPAVAGDPESPVREKLLQFLRARASSPEIVVTFRHMEDGWVDTPEPKRENRRRRRGRPERRAETLRPQPARPERRPEGGRRPEKPGRREAGRPAQPPRPAQTPRPPQTPRPAQPPRPAASATPPEGPIPRPAGKKRFRRRRRGGGRGGGAPPGASRAPE